jgi:hypothetical protein
MRNPNIPYAAKAWLEKPDGGLSQLMRYRIGKNATPQAALSHNGTGADMSILSSAPARANERKKDKANQTGAITKTPATY